LKHQLRQWKKLRPDTEVLQAEEAWDEDT